MNVKPTVATTHDSTLFLGLLCSSSYERAGSKSNTNPCLRTAQCGRFPVIGKNSDVPADSRSAIKAYASCKPVDYEVCIAAHLANDGTS